MASEACDHVEVEMRPLCDDSKKNATEAAATESDDGGETKGHSSVRQRITIVMGIIYGITAILLFWPCMCSIAIAFLTDAYYGVAMFRPARFNELSRTHQTCLRVGTQVLLWMFLALQILWFVGLCLATAFVIYHMAAK